MSSDEFYKKLFDYSMQILMRQSERVAALEDRIANIERILSDRGEVK